MKKLLMLVVFLGFAWGDAFPLIAPSEAEARIMPWTWGRRRPRPSPAPAPVDTPPPRLDPVLLPTPKPPAPAIDPKLIDNVEKVLKDSAKEPEPVIEEDEKSITENPWLLAIAAGGGGLLSLFAKARGEISGLIDD